MSAVPGILGMNMIRRCNQELFGQYGPALFNTTPVVDSPSSLVHALQKCHLASQQPLPTQPGKARLQGKRACRIPAGTLKIMPATCAEQYSGTTVLFEPLQSGLPAGFLASPALVQVVRGTAYVPIVNVGDHDVLLYPRTHLGTLDSGNAVSLPAGVTEDSSMAACVSSQIAASAPDPVAAVDLSPLPTEDQERVRALLGKYTAIFAAHDPDLGRTNLITHDIPLLDDVPVRQRYRCIPPRRSTSW